MSDVYSGNSFSIDRAGDDWTIWRYCDDESREQIILTRDAMDELRDFFTETYSEVAAMRER